MSDNKIVNEWKLYFTEKHTCECGGRYDMSHASQHQDTNKHRKYMNKPLKEKKMYECECGTAVRYSQRWIHWKSIKHIKYMEELPTMD